MGPSARVRMIRDQFVTSHRDCDLRQHLDSVPQHMPIRDIVDRCRVWESHAESEDRCLVKLTQSVYSVSDQVVRPVDRVVTAVATPLLGLADLETLLKRLLLSTTAPAPPPGPVPGEIETMLERLLSLLPVQVQASLPRSATTDMESVLQCRDWITVVCFSCGRPGHGVSKCPKLDEAFP